MDRVKGYYTVADISLTVVESFTLIKFLSA